MSAESHRLLSSSSSQIINYEKETNLFQIDEFQSEIPWRAASGKFPVEMKWSCRIQCGIYSIDATVGGTLPARRLG